MDEEEEDSDLGLGDDSFEFPEWKAAPEDVKDDEDDEDDEQGSGSCVGRKGGRQQRQLVKVGPPRPAGGGQERSRSTSDGGREDEEERERETFRLVGRLFGGRRVFPGPRREAEGATLKVSTPFCPFWGPERHDFEAFKAAKMASWWRSDLRVAKRSKNFGAERLLSEIRAKSFTGEPVYRSFPGLRAMSARCQSLLRHDPLAPDSLRSSSSRLKVFCGPGGGLHLAYAKEHGVYAHRLLGGDGGEGGEGGDSLLSYRPDGDDMREMADFAEVHTVLGFDVMEDPLLFVLRHRRSLALVGLDGDVKCNWKVEEEGGGGEDLCTAVGLPLLDAVAMVDAGGTVRLNSYVENEALNVWEGSLKETVGPHRWACLDPSAEHPSVLRIAGRREVSLFDLRSKSSVGGSARTVLHRTVSLGSSQVRCRGVRNRAWEHAEVVAGMATSRRKPFHLYCATTDQLLLLDERMPGQAADAWTHAQEGLTVGCEVSPCGGDGEVVAVYSDRGGLDALCTNGGGSSGGMTRIASATDNLSPNGVPLLGYDYLGAPVTGLAMLAAEDGGEEEEKISVLTLNSASMILCAELRVVPSGRDVNERGEEESPGGADDSLDLFAVSKEELVRERWRRWSGRVREIRYRKRPLATTVHERGRLPTASEGAVRSVPVVSCVRRSLAEEILAEPRPDFVDGRQKLDADAGRHDHFEALPWLKPLAPGEHDDRAGDRVAKIFEGKTIFPHLSGSASDTSAFEPVSLGRSRKKKKRKEEASVSATEPDVPQDTSYTISSFLRGLDPFMTSTQEQEDAQWSQAASPQTHFNLDSQGSTLVQQTQEKDNKNKKRRRSKTSTIKKKQKTVVGF